MTEPSETILAMVEKIWGLVPILVGGKVYGMWRGGVLHSVALGDTHDSSDLAFIFVSISDWIDLRMCGDQLLVQTTVYTPTKEGVSYVNWKPSSGVSYRPQRNGIGIPIREFNPVKSKSKEKT